MVKTTRRVKRVKRVKRTKRTKRNGIKTKRYTRRQRGGAIIKVCEKSGYDLFGTSKGIAISYDDETQKYTIGNESYEKLKSNPRYANALDALPNPPPMNDGGSIILTQSQFDNFKSKYCGYANVNEQCGLITGFRPPVAPAAVASASVSVAPVATASTAPNIQDQVSESLDLKTPNQLKVNKQYIAYMNHSGIVKSFPVDKSKTEYEFDNLTIQLSDGSGSVINGNLKVIFKLTGQQQVTTNFTLTLNNVEPTDTLIKCMRQLIDTPFAEAKITSINSVGMFSKKIEVNGELTESRIFSKNLSTYNLQYLIDAFVERYESCSDPATQMADLRVAGPADVARVIGSKIAMLEKRLLTMSAEEKTRFEALRQQFREAGNNLALLNKISTEIDQLADARRARIYPAAKGGKTRRKIRVRMHRH
jgi:hypothetical protein